MANITYKFRKNIDIGSLDAESDHLLLKAFVEKHEFEVLVDSDTVKSIIIGRTGAGKSALIKYIENNEEHVVRIDPESLSLRHLSNSDIINYFKEIGVKLDLFYKLLWKHVFIVELIKIYFSNDLSKSNNFLEWLKEKITGNNKRKKAVEYLENWEKKFWEDTEYRIKELETSLESRFKSELGGGIKLTELIELSQKSENESKAEQNVKYEVLNKAQKVVNESQIEEIKEIFTILKDDLFTKTQKRCFLIIDDLDKEWVSNTIVYDLIKALIDSIREFNEIPNVKVIIALRSNIQKIIFQENLSRGVQREKYANLYIKLEWSKAELTLLINNRLKELMKGSYTNDIPTIKEVLPDSSKKLGDPFDYILDRTFMRPRDVIDFFNKCIRYADDKTKFTWDIIKQAESDYSVERLQAVGDEWLENYGYLECFYGFLEQQKGVFDLSEVKTHAGDYFLERISSNDIMRLSQNMRVIFQNFGSDFDTDAILKRVCLVLYEVGIIGVKISPETKLEYYYEYNNLLTIRDFNEKSKFYVHPMFHKALRIVV